jgi:hypothetical protein
MPRPIVRVPSAGDVSGPPLILSARPDPWAEVTRLLKERVNIVAAAAVIQLTGEGTTPGGLMG